jgi:hypothetical protein
MDHGTSGRTDICTEPAFDAGKKIIVTGGLFILAEFTKFSQEIGHHFHRTYVNTIPAANTRAVFISDD